MKIFTGYRYYNINNSIKFNLIKLINSNSIYLGIFKINDVLKISRNLKLDIIEISTNYNIFLSICKIVDSDKFQYLELKKYNNKKKNKLIFRKKDDKEMSFSLFININDYLNKISKIIKILSKNINVKVSIPVKGREVIKTKLLRDLVDRLKLSLINYGVIEVNSKFDNVLNYLYFYNIKKKK